jgi:hypothetical protein
MCSWCARNPPSFSGSLAGQGQLLALSVVLILPACQQLMFAADLNLCVSNLMR